MYICAYMNYIHTRYGIENNCYHGAGMPDVRFLRTGQDQRVLRVAAIQSPRLRGLGWRALDYLPAC